MSLCWHGSTLHFGLSLHAAANSSADAAAAPHLYVLQLTGMTPALDETAFCAGKPCAGFNPLCWQGSALLHPRTTRTSSAQASLHLTCWQRRSALKQLRGQALFACLFTARGAGCSQALSHPICWQCWSEVAHSGVEMQGCVPLSLHLLMKGPERYHMNPTAAIVGHLVCQLPHRLASCCYMHFCVDCSARVKCIGAALLS